MVVDGRRMPAVLVALALAVLAGCASVPEPTSREFVVPVFPPPPEVPRFYYERTVYGSADVRLDDENASLRRLVTGEGRRTDVMDKPYGVAAIRGRVYVTDTIKRMVHVFDLPKATYETLGTDPPGELRQPFGVDVDAAGNVYVVDGTIRAVLVFDAAGRYLRRFADGGALRRPGGIAVEPAGNRAYVVDAGGVDSDRHRVIAFDARTGAQLFEFGSRGTGPGEFNLPRDVAISPTGEIYVVDGGNFRVGVFDAQGRFLREFGSVGRQTGQCWRPKEVATDRDGNVYVVDTAFGNFQIFNRQGQLLLDVGGRSNRDEAARYMLPSGIAVDQDGRVYMVDQFYRKLEVYRPAALAPTAGFASPLPAAGSAPPKAAAK
ncbi:MAG: 6-bladed beta-propeller [Burkholderiales bacterium]|nr:6-bladed beta-propeller [Burkholderiales bacterium]